MRKSRIRYILTWASGAGLLASSTLLVAGAWNSQLARPLPPALILGGWALLCASGIFLFLLAVKKAHRQWVNEKRDLEKEEQDQKTRSASSESTRGTKTLSPGPAARKILRHISEKMPLDQVGKQLMKDLAGELEIMSGIFYVEEKGTFQVRASYALASSTEPYTFKSGEGLSGQAARNRQLMVLTNLPEEHLEVCSGLGKAQPAYLAIVPLVHKGRTVALLECSGYRYEPSEIEQLFRIFTRELMEKLSPNLA
jgi:hypothetical protein